MSARLLVVAALAACIAVAAWRARRPVDTAALTAAAAGHVVPTDLVGEADRTWIVFSTPYCATCGPVEEQLRARFPEHDVRRADVEQWATTATDLGVRRAPTVVRVDRSGSVDLVLAGPEAVRGHLGFAALR